MRRFEIQEMVSQSQQGVAYLALDNESGREVALRRFFPFGQDNGGLSGEQKNAYLETCQRLMRITHTNLRFVVDGGVDASDETPYLATEWVEGYSLKQILAGENLDPARTIDVVRAALQVSLELSEAFGEKAIWVDTDLDSIVVSDEASDRGYTFWVCPKRWFNTKPKLREVKSIAAMAEELTGWNARAYTKDSGGGFGGWVKTMKSVPCMTVESALLQLNDLFGKKQSKPTAKISHRAVAKPTPAAASKPTPKPVPQMAKNPATRPTTVAVTRPAASAQSSPVIRPSYQPMGSATTQPITPVGARADEKKRGFMGPLLAISACLAIAAVFGNLVIQNRIKLREQLAKNEAIERAEQEARNSKPAAGSSLKTGSKQTAVATPKPTPATGNIPKTSPVKTSPPKPSNPSSRPNTFSPTEIDRISKLSKGTPVKLQGILRSIKQEKLHDGRLVYTLKFGAEDSIPRITAIAPIAGFSGDLNQETFEAYLGKPILISGTYERGGHRRGRKYHVAFQKLDAISLGGGTNHQQPADSTPSETDPANGAPVFAPNEVKQMRGLGSGAPVTMKGVLNSVTEQENGYIKLYFSAPDKAGWARAWADPKNFEGELNTRMFESYIGKEIIIEGIYDYEKDWEFSHNVRFTKASQVRLSGAQSANQTAPDETAPDTDEHVLMITPDEDEKVRQLPIGTLVKLRGTPHSISTQGLKNGEIFTINFEGGNVSGKADTRAFKGNLTEEILKSYIGKEITIEGTSDITGGRRKSATVYVTDLKKINVLGN